MTHKVAENVFTNEAIWVVEPIKQTTAESFSLYQVQFIKENLDIVGHFLPHFLFWILGKEFKHREKNGNVLWPSQVFHQLRNHITKTDDDLITIISG